MTLPGAEDSYRPILPFTEQYPPLIKLPPNNAITKKATAARKSPAATESGPPTITQKRGFDPGRDPR